MLTKGDGSTQVENAKIRATRRRHYVFILQKSPIVVMTQGA
jgi:hypothetical protein